MTPLLQRLMSPIAAVLAFGLLTTVLSAHPAAADPPLRLVFAAELAPLSFEKSGKITGILVEVAREIFVKRLGERMIASLYPWERAQQMVRSGAADGFITIATAERATYANCGRIPVLRVPLRPLVRQNHPRLKEIEAATSLADLRPFDFVSYLGNGWAKENLADFNVYYAADYGAALRGLAQGRGDLALVTTTTGAYYMRESHLMDKLVMLPLVADTFEYVLCLGKNSPHVARLAEFDRVLEVMRADGGYRPILQQYGLDPDSLY
jgi:polar amino acid transport system substrate-binding protein